MRLYGPKDVDKKALRKAKIAVLGYGSQGRAHALNLKDSGFDVVVGVRKGKSFEQAKKDGLNVTTPAEAVVGATLIAMLVPFTLLVLKRALLIAATSGKPFCAVKFDCGCGAGEVFICHKLLENTALLLLAAWLLTGRGRQLCLRFSLRGEKGSPPASTG